ncbi:tRNA glutamyl-Q(34) synthetase GluQRS [Agaricicola taiwanensis]|uniref:tRNA glutamyl-Q(34) synthetase GluQRS n=1 Tax=Agaricicola taiwanensis TaxID=591372 RepID=A0A8J2YM28_9RHOB|nr:tRNA glutamyl-Q(34) synthetase GluQRS [Agaricicola taiwanensis]GGE51289.1 tRNA glutamyl-Q(34) synthetase GluQRS [Agaricicola taiwanensis]
MTSVFRFAPSPNGFLHLGHAYSALLNADLARAAGGRFLLRIEDIDPERSRPTFEEAIYHDLRWLGLDWPEPVRRQSEHVAEHAEALQPLKRRRLVYPCFCTRGEIRAEVARRGPSWPRDPDGSPLYPGTCRHIVEPERLRRLGGGAPHLWRLDMARAVAETGPLSWTGIAEDGTMHDILADPARWGDVVIARRDVPTSYHLSVVLDDAAQRVTHVVRGQDLYHATAIHRLLQVLLELPAPLYRHHRLVLDEEGRKLSKSIGSASLRSLREAGESPAGIRRRLGL